MRLIARLGGKARTRPGMGGGKKLSASLRERLRSSIDEDRLAEVLVSGLESENARERLDVAKLVLPSLLPAPRCRTGFAPVSRRAASTAPNSSHGYRAVGKPILLADLVAEAVQAGMVEARGDKVVVEGVVVGRVDPGTPPKEVARSTSRRVPWHGRNGP